MICAAAPCARSPPDHGKFGGRGDEDHDDMISDTRWEPFKDLARHLSEPQLALLDTWAAGLKKDGS